MVIRISAVILLLIGLLPAVAVAQEAPPPLKRHGAPGLLPEPGAMTTGFDFAGKYLGDTGDESEGADGFYPLFKSGITGSGFISGGGGYRRRVLDKHAIVDGSAALSWSGYKITQARFEFFDLADGHLVVGSQALWQDLTQLQYFGDGPDSHQANRSDYRLKSTDVVGYAKYRPTRWLSFGGRLGRLGRPTLSSSAGRLDPNFPDATVTFAGEPGFEPTPQPSFLHRELSVTADTRDYPGHPYRGGLYRAAWSAYSDRDLEAFSFHRYELEAAQFVTVAPDRWTIALHGWSVISDTASGQQVPVYLLPSLGGSTTLRSYADYRFHDRHMLLLSAESRWALFTHVDAALFVDAGSVAPRVRDLDLSTTSYGIGFRIHAHQSTTARLDVARGAEGWRILLRLDEPFRLSRLSRHMAAIPFVP